jgi:hypothetical protein
MEKELSRFSDYSDQESDGDNDVINSKVELLLPSQDKDYQDGNVEAEIPYSVVHNSLES